MSKPVSWEVPLQAKPTLRWMMAGIENINGTRPLQIWNSPDIWSLNVFRGPGEIQVAGTWHRFAGRCANLIPPCEQVIFRCPPDSPLLFVHFQFPTEYIERNDKVFIPALVDLGSEFESFWNALQHAINNLYRPWWRSEVRLWEILCHLADIVAGSGPHGFRHLSMIKAQRLIESQLSQPLNVAAIAHQVGLSHNHLNRLFRAETGTTVSAYIRQLRMRHAEHLLRHSNLPIKTIAAQVGIRDWQTFNHIVRRELGKSPREIRHQAHRNTKSDQTT